MYVCAKKKNKYSITHLACAFNKGHLIFFSFLEIGNLHLVTYCIFFVIVDSRISIIVHFDTPEIHTHTDASTVTSFLLFPFTMSLFCCWFFYYVTSFEEFRWHLFIFDALLYSMHDSSIDSTSSIQKKIKSRHCENSATDQTQQFYFIS